MPITYMYNRERERERKERIVAAIGNSLLSARGFGAIGKVLESRTCNSLNSAHFSPVL